jgi:PTH1 family peptidyl-tRNA hydrolase
MKLIAGLGNPGNIYSHNRHNIGFMCISHLAREIGAHFDKKEGLARTAHAQIEGQQIILARPQTYMNASGEAIKKLMEKYHLTLDDIIVIHDDMDFKPGQIRIRKGGSSAGHNGIASIIHETGGSDFIRIRVGIGHPGDNANNNDMVVRDYVLSDFNADEAKIISEVIPQVSQAIITLLNEGLDAAMNRFNRSGHARPDAPPAVPPA